MAKFQDYRVWFRVAGTDEFASEIVSARSEFDAEEIARLKAINAYDAWFVEWSAEIPSLTEDDGTAFEAYCEERENLIEHGVGDDS